MAEPDAAVAPDGGGPTDASAVPLPDAYVRSGLVAPWGLGAISGAPDAGLALSVEAYQTGPNMLYLRGAGRSGFDVGRTGDDLAFAYQAMTGPSELVARLRPTGACDRTEAKFGVMVRASLAHDAPYAWSGMTGSNIARIQYRPSFGAASRVATEQGRTIDPIFVRVARHDDVLTAELSPDGQRWWSRSFVTTGFGPSALFGLALASREDKPCDVFFDRVRFRSALPHPWRQDEIGTEVDEVGRAVFTGGAFEIDGTGDDIDVGTNDHFFFTHQDRSGDVAVVARLDAFTGTDDKAVAGLMMRTGFDDSDPMAALLYGPSRSPSWCGPPSRARPPSRAAWLG